MSGKLIGAIDIGTTKIVAVVGEIDESGDGFRVLRYHVTRSQGIRSGMIEDFQKVVNSIDEAVRGAGLLDEFGITEVYVGVAGHTVRSTVNSSYRVIRESEVTKEHIDELKYEMYNTVVDESEIVLHVIERMYIIDDQYEYRNPIGIEAKKIEGRFHLIIANKSFINSVKRCIENVGLRVKRFVFEPLASAEAVLTDAEIEAGVALVDIGGGTTDLVVIKDDVVLHSAVIPLGGDAISEDIKNALKILASKAEETKINHGKAIAGKSMENDYIKIKGIAGRDAREISVRDLAQIIQARVLEIVDSVHEEIKEFKNDIAAGVTLTGGGALLEQIDLFFRYRMGIDVRLGVPYVAEISELAKPQFSTTIGLLKKGVEYEKKLMEKESDTKRQFPGFRERNVGTEQNPGANLKGFFNKLFKSFFSDPNDEI